VQCGRGEGCNVTTKSRGRSRLWPNGLQKNEAASYGQATGLQNKPSRFCCRRRTHTTLWSCPLATLHSCEATSFSPRDDHASLACFPGAKCVAHTHCYGAP
jgi:hypothetical protein